MVWKYKHGTGEKERKQKQVSELVQRVGSTKFISSQSRPLGDDFTFSVPAVSDQPSCSESLLWSTAGFRLDLQFVDRSPLKVASSAVPTLIRGEPQVTNRSLAARQNMLFANCKLDDIPH